MDADLLKLLGTGGIAAALLFLIYLVGNRLVAAIDRISAKVDEHTKVDVDAHAEVKEGVVALNAKFDAVLDNQQRLTPVEGIPIARVHGEYSVRGRKP